MSAPAVLAERIAAQGLGETRGASPVAVVNRLLAVQAQDPRGARLAIRARGDRLLAVDVDRALDERELIITWLNRGTLHLVRSADYPFLQLLTTPPLFSSSARRLRQEGVSEEQAGRAMEVIECALDAAGPLTRAQLRSRLEAAGIPTGGQALVHLLFLAAIRGLIVRGPMLGGEHAYVLVREWLGAPRPPDRAAALAQLARRYLVGHGPATDRDLARWAGLPLRDARAGLEAIAAELRRREDGLLQLAAQAPDRAPALPPPLLLGAFDPLLLGWTSREEIVGPHRLLVSDNGLFRPFALVRGRAVATWRLQRGRVAIEYLEEVPKRAAAALGREAAAVEAFFTDPRP
ncbi:MAG: winged helix DNA-binding domain-containing protein [Solirubrobacterales bacterium]